MCGLKNMYEMTGINLGKMASRWLCQSRRVGRRDWAAKEKRKDNKIKEDNKGCKYDCGVWREMSWRSDMAPAYLKKNM